MCYKRSISYHRLFRHTQQTGDMSDTAAHCFTVAVLFARRDWRSGAYDKSQFCVGKGYCAVFA